MAYYVPPSEKVGGHVPHVPHQIAPMPMTQMKNMKIRRSIVLIDERHLRRSTVLIDELPSSDKEDFLGFEQ